MWGVVARTALERRKGVNPLTWLRVSGSRELTFCQQFTRYE